MADIIHRIGIQASLPHVHAALSTVEGIAGWWTRDASGSTAADGSVEVRFADTDGKEKGRMTFTVVAESEQRIRWRFTTGPEEWLGTEVTFDLGQDGAMTLILFGHRNWAEPVEFMAHCSMKWAVFLLSLRQLLETGRGRPAPEDLKIDNWN